MTWEEKLEEAKRLREAGDEAGAQKLTDEAEAMMVAAGHPGEEISDPDLDPFEVEFEIIATGEDYKPPTGPDS